MRCDEREDDFACAGEFEALSLESQTALTRFVLAEAKRLDQGTMRPGSDCTDPEPARTGSR